MARRLRKRVVMIQEQKHRWFYLNSRFERLRANEKHLYHCHRKSKTEIIDSAKPSNKPEVLLLLPNPINIHLDFLIIKAGQTSNKRRLCSRILIPPDNIFILITIDSDVIVVRYSLVRAPGCRIAVRNVLPSKARTVSYCYSSPSLARLTVF